MKQKLILLAILVFLIPVVGAVTITNTTSQTTITWNWTGTPSGISNLTIDGYEVCGVSPSLTKFLLNDLDPATTHEINVTYLGTYTLQSTTTLNATVGASTSSGGDGGAAGAAFGLVGGLIGAVLAVSYLKERKE